MQPDGDQQQDRTDLDDGGVGGEDAEQRPAEEREHEGDGAHGGKCQAHRALLDLPGAEAVLTPHGLSDQNHGGSADTVPGQQAEADDARHDDVSGELGLAGGGDERGEHQPGQLVDKELDAHGDTQLHEPPHAAHVGGEPAVAADGDDERGDTHGGRCDGGTHSGSGGAHGGERAHAEDQRHGQHHIQRVGHDGGPHRRPCVARALQVGEDGVADKEGDDRQQADVEVLGAQRADRAPAADQLDDVEKRQQHHHQRGHAGAQRDSLTQGASGEIRLLGADRLGGDDLDGVQDAEAEAEHREGGDDAQPDGGGLGSAQLRDQQRVHDAHQHVTETRDDDGPGGTQNHEQVQRTRNYIGLIAPRHNVSSARRSMNLKTPSSRHVLTTSSSCATASRS